MDDGRLHRSGLRIIDGGLAGVRGVPTGAAAPQRPAEPPTFRVLDVVVSYLDLPGEDVPAILILPAARHQVLTHDNWRMIERGVEGLDSGAT